MPLTVQGRVVKALVLRDMRTRFGGTYLSFAIAVLWPLSHLALILVIQLVTNRPPIAGESGILFMATGVVPFIAFQYVARNIMTVRGLNAPLLYFPIVTMLDLVIARTIVEAAIVYIVTAATWLTLYICGIDTTPWDPVTVIYGWIVAIILGISVGVLNSAIASVWPQYTIAYIIFSLALYISSGILFSVSQLPSKFAWWLLWNPLLHVVEWIRSGYYPAYGAGVVSSTYVFGFCLATLASGLALERFLRGRGL